MGKSALLREINERRKQYSTSNEATKCIYILELDRSILTSKKAMKSLRFPKGEKFPKLKIGLRGCVYVGVSSHTPEQRFTIHAKKGKKAAKIAKLGFLKDYDSFDRCGREITALFGFDKIGWRDNKPEFLESWLAWRLYKIGYYVWGSHIHEDVDFLGKPPYE